MNGSQVFNGLNPAQREAVETIEGPLLIVAGPGSGKTRVITHRIAYLMGTCAINPRHILAVTFTNKAARGLKTRLHSLVGDRAHFLHVGTFHAFCALLLRNDGEAVGVASNYTIYDTQDQLALIKKAIYLAEMDPKQHPPRALQSRISRAKSDLMDSQGLAESQTNYFEESCARVYHHYEELLGRNNAVDFDDLIMKSVQLVEAFPEVQNKYQSRFEYLMVDEFQDTSQAQYRLMRLLTGKHHNICVVGDPDQAIYSWRNADIRNIHSFQTDYPEAKLIALEQNYRSSRTILEAAKHVISVNGIRLQKHLFTENDQGHPVVVHEAYDVEEEASFVVSEVRRLVRQKGFSAGDCAVLYRVNAQSRALEEACLRAGMEYRLVGGVRFYQRREVKDLMAYLRLLSNPFDEVNLVRALNVPARGVGPKTLLDLNQWAQSQSLPLYSAMEYIADALAAGNPCPAPLTFRAGKIIAGFVSLIKGLVKQSSRVGIVDLIDLVLQDSGFRQYIQGSDDQPEERWENIMEMRETAREFNSEEPPYGLFSLLERISLVADVDQFEESDEALTLITLHQAKGLEFPVVFIVGLEEGLLPHARSMDQKEDLEEERRLCYVGMTRAEQYLYLVRCFRRGFQGGGPTIASRFLQEVPARLVESAYKSQAGIVQNVLGSVGVEPQNAPVISHKIRLELEPGDLVQHSSFGEGVVISCFPSGADHEVTVEFGKVGMKRLLLEYAPLTKVKE
jgi:DNA helicase-2/ATP-dependent DNA helicase PcrA